MQPPPPPARPARQGGVPSSPRLPALAPAPLPFFSSSRTWESPGSPESPRPRVRRCAPGAGQGRAPDAPSAACSRRPRPTRRPAHFPRRRPTSPGGRPRAGRRRRAGRDALCSRRCGRRSRRARRGRSGAGGGGGGRGSPASPSRRRSAAPRPRAHRPLALRVGAQLFLLPFSLQRSRQLVLGAGGRKRARAPPRADTLPPVPRTPPPRRQHNKKPFTCEEVTLGRTARPRRRRPRGRGQKLGRRAALGARVRAPRTATPATPQGRRCAPAPAPAPARAPRPAPRTRPTPRTQLPARPRPRPRPGAISCRRRPSRRRPANSGAHRVGRAGASDAPCRSGNKTRSGLRSWLGGRGRGSESTGAELAGSERGSGEFRGLRVPRLPPQGRSFV